MNDIDLRALARNFFDIGVKAADPATAVRSELIKNPIRRPNGRLLVISIGKAAISMAKEALQHSPTGIPQTAIAITNYENAENTPGIEVFSAGHPKPDGSGLKASRYIEQKLKDLTAEDSVLFLISGDGSALLPAPVVEVGLDDKIKATQISLGSGLDIIQINLVRQHLSRFKGGGLARLCYPASLRALTTN